MISVTFNFMQMKRLPIPLLIIIAVLLVAFGLGWFARSTPVRRGTLGGSTDQQKGVPSFGSVAMIGKGALAGIGPDWAVLQESNKVEPIFSGASSTHSLLVKQIGNNLVMRASEIMLQQEQLGKKELERLAVRKISVQDKTIFIIPTGDASGAQGLIRCGTTSCVMVEISYGTDRPFEPLSSDIPQPVLQFIANADLP